MKFILSALGAVIAISISAALGLPAAFHAIAAGVGLGCGWLGYGLLEERKERLQIQRELDVRAANGILSDSTHSLLQLDESSSTGGKLVAALCALLVTAIMFAGFIYLRKRSAQQRLAAIAAQAPPSDVPKGPAKAHILVDDALLKGRQTIIGGTVKNISSENLSGLAVALELRRRKDGSLEQTSAAVEPSDLEPDQEGRYVLKLPAQQYISVRLVGLKGGADSVMLPYTTASGQKRPPEKVGAKMVTVPRPGPREGEFLNSPDKPARVP
jgi:hypothetical protein